MQIAMKGNQISIHLPSFSPRLLHIFALTVDTISVNFSQTTPTRI
uniref:Uncharacterized protein n=1 Tax=Arundo donax TaxID=35708 RepID=A0A0A9GZK7_ARUDO